MNLKLYHIIFITFLLTRCNRSQSGGSSISNHQNTYHNTNHSDHSHDSDDEKDDLDEIINNLFNPNKNKGTYIAKPTEMSEHQKDCLINMGRFGYKPSSEEVKWGKRKDFSEDELKQKAGEYYFIDNLKDGNCEVRAHTLAILHGISTAPQEQFEDILDKLKNIKEEMKFSNFHHDFFPHKKKYDQAVKLISLMHKKNIHELLLAINDKSFNEIVVDFFLRHIIYKIHKDNGCLSDPLIGPDMHRMIIPGTYGSKTRFSPIQAFRGITTPSYFREFDPDYISKSPIKLVRHRYLPHTDIAISKSLFNKI